MLLCNWLIEQFQLISLYLDAGFTVICQFSVTGKQNPKDKIRYYEDTSDEYQFKLSNVESLSPQPSLSTFTLSRYNVRTVIEVSTHDYSHAHSPQPDMRQGETFTFP